MADPSTATDLVAAVKAEEAQDLEKSQKDEAFQLAVSKGWEMMNPGSADRIRNNVMCQSVAMCAGATTLFFAAFNEFTKALVEMPSEMTEASTLSSVRDESVEAYKNTYKFSVEYAKALQTLGMFQGNIPALKELVEMYADDDEVAPADDVMEASRLNAVSHAVTMLAAGADDQVNRAFQIVGKAMALQAQGNAWKAQLDDEQKAKDEFDKAQEAYIGAKTNVEYMTDEGNLIALQGKEASLHASLEAATKLFEDNQAGRRKLFDDMKKAYESNKDDAVAMAKMQQKAWEVEHARLLRDCQDAVTAARRVVEAGGYKTYHTEMQTVEEAKAGWFSNYTLTSRRPVTNVQCNLTGAQEALQVAIDRENREKSRTNPHDPSKAPMPRVPDWSDFKGDSEKEEQRLLKIKAEIADLEGQITTAQAKVNSNKEQVKASEDEWNRKKEVWEERKKALTEGLGDVGGNEMAKKVIAAYQAGLMIQQAISIVGFMQSTASNGLEATSGTMKVLLKAVCSGKTAKAQLNRLKKLEDLCSMKEDNASELAVLLNWLKAVGGMYMPLPAPEGVTKAAIDEAFEQQAEAAKAALADVDEDDTPAEFDTPLVVD